MTKLIEKKFLSQGVLDYFENQIEAVDAKVETEKARIDQELLDRAAADSVLDGKIEQEILDREAGDSALDVRITALEGQVGEDLQTAITDLEAADLVLDGKIETEKGRIDAILAASEADKDTFAEIVQLINSVDTENDQAFASYVLSNNAAVTAVEGRLDAVEPKVSTLEGEMDSVEAGIEALELRASALEAKDVVIEESIADEVARAIAAEEAIAQKFIDLGGFVAITSSAGTTDLLATQHNAVVTGTQTHTIKMPSTVGMVVGERFVIINRSSGMVTLQTSAGGALTPLPPRWMITLIVNGSGSYTHAANPTVQASAMSMGSIKITDLANGTAEKDAVNVGQLDSTRSILETYINEKDGVLTGLINDEVARATLAEQNLGNDIVALGETLDGKIEVEKGRIDAILSASEADKDSFAEIVALINSVDTENDSAFASYVLSNDAAVAAVEGRLDAVEPKVSTLEGEMDAAQSAIGAVEGRLDVVEPKVSTLESEMDTAQADIQAVEGRVDEVETRVEALEAKKVPVPKQKYFLIDEVSELSYLDLGDLAMPESLVVFYNINVIRPGLDFDVSTVEGQTRLTWISDLVPGQRLGVESGDEFFVSYMV